MGQPAYSTPIEDTSPLEGAGAGEATADAATQTTRLVVIEGGKSAATAGGAGVAEGAAVAEAGAATEGAAAVEGAAATDGLLAGALGVGAAALAGLVVLFWPSEIGPEYPKGHRPDASAPPQAPADPPVQVCPAPEEAPKPEPRKYPNQTCPNEVLAQLQGEKDELVRQIPPRSPLDTGNPKKAVKLPCSYVRARLEQMQMIKAKRRQIQDVCFGGAPDPGHAKALDNVDESIARYKALRDTNCAAGHPMANL